MRCGLTTYRPVGAKPNVIVLHRHNQPRRGDSPVGPGVSPGIPRIGDIRSIPGYPGIKKNMSASKTYKKASRYNREAKTNNYYGYTLLAYPLGFPTADEPGGHQGTFFFVFGYRFAECANLDLDELQPGSVFLFHDVQIRLPEIYSNHPGLSITEKGDL